MGACLALGGLGLGSLHGEAGYLLFMRAQALGQSSDHTVPCCVGLSWKVVGVNHRQSSAGSRAERWRFKFS
jgi:hypothetical protein